MILDFGFWILEGRDDPAVVVRDSQRMINPNRRGRFSLRREKPKWVEGRAAVLLGSLTLSGLGRMPIAASDRGVDGGLVFGGRIRYGNPAVLPGKRGVRDLSGGQQLGR